MAGQAGRAESLLLYLQPLGLFTAWVAPVPPPCPSRALQPGAGLPQGLVGTWHVHPGLGRLTVGRAWCPQAGVGAGRADSKCLLY